MDYGVFETTTGLRYVRAVAEATIGHRLLLTGTCAECRSWLREDNWVGRANHRFLVAFHAGTLRIQSPRKTPC